MCHPSFWEKALMIINVKKIDKVDFMII
jgi:hypothetical protein